ncbi:cytochrome P450 [Lentinula edodes]|uniref:cytochrome P450 n=1 Tax=Lentinula edodes TaxID=5353 RepID=UPI001E8D1823|nr:cytochrome P450 [Lentinula edodes]KAH7878803.1 cytochrome P450 [Lentinula edodes]
MLTLLVLGVSALTLGHEYEISHQTDAGQLEFEWVERYGPTIRIFGCFHEEVLMIADPMGLQHIFQSQNYPKTRDIRLIAERVFGKGLLWATGEAHQRHRRALNPAFSNQNLKKFVPLFQETTLQKWNARLEGNAAVVLNMAQWMPKITLDVIGRSAFDFNFGLLDGTADYNELYRTMRDMFLDSKSSSTVTVLYDAIRRRIPERFGFKMYTTKEDRRLSAFLSAAQRAARNILLRKQEVEMPNANSDDDKDILSVLIRATKHNDHRKKLYEDEIISQMATIILAGNETTSSTMSWMLYELSKHADSQTRVHEEITILRAQTGCHVSLTSAHYDSMPYFNAVIKETLRLHPILPILVREADEHDTIPLSILVKSKTGSLLPDVPIRKGQRILLHLGAYNRLTQVWGDDADSWNPVRFIDEKKEVVVGMYGNLATFSEACHIRVDLDY